MLFSSPFSFDIQNTYLVNKSRKTPWMTRHMCFENLDVSRWAFFHSIRALFLARILLKLVDLFNTSGKVNRPLGFLPLEWALCTMLTWKTHVCRIFYTVEHLTLCLPFIQQHAFKWIHWKYPEFNLARLSTFLTTNLTSTSFVLAISMSVC